MAFGLGAPVLFGMVGVAVDYSTWSRQKTLLQKAADAAAIAATRELQLGKTDEQRVQAVAQAIVDSHITPKPGDSPVTVTATPIRGDQKTAAMAPLGTLAPYRGVKVTVRQRKDAIMSRLVTPELTDMEARATAQLAGGAKVCVVGLEEVKANAIQLKDSAQISAADCSVYANSTNREAIRAEKNARITAALTCSAGGYRQDSSANFAPQSPVTDCPKTADPLLSRPPPPSDACPTGKSATKGLTVKDKVTTLYPGTYCRGLYIEKGATVTLSPGIYVIKDGPLIIGPAVAGSTDTDGNQDTSDDGTLASRGSVIGTGVGFFFTGTPGVSSSGGSVGMRFEKNSVVEITAPTSGPMAGLLFYEDRAATPDRTYEILSDGARRLVGTIYLPRGLLKVSANQSVADQSEYTAVVAKRIELKEAPNLVLNTRYGATPVPVPTGLGVVAGSARLTE